MSQLVFIESGRAVTDSLTVAEAFGKEHKRVMQDIRELDCSDEFNEHNFVPISYQDSMNREKPKYLITQDGFSFLVMGYTGKEAARFKELYIGEFNRMRDELSKPAVQPSYTLEDPIKRAERWIEEQKERQVVEGKVLMLEQQVAEYEPKISYLDQILKSKKTLTLTQIAGDYDMTARALNKLLHEERVQRKVNGQWILYSEHHGKGLTKSETIQITRSNGEADVTLNTRWTQKGRLFIHEILGKRGIIPVMEKEWMAVGK
ncbi:phage regulatory protein, rha family [Paenibacillaceae bacterium GAS479]|nr:phage regulatory protein, rha family [Paenibacillaceae bacterium GAS479]